MEIYYRDKKLFVDIDETINLQTITGLKNKMYNIINMYAINDVILNILTDTHFDQKLLDDLVADYQSNYNGHIKINWIFKPVNFIKIIV